MDYEKACELADHVSPVPSIAHEALMVLRDRCRALEAQIADDPWRAAIRDACAFAGVDFVDDGRAAQVVNNLVKYERGEAALNAGESAVAGFAAGVHELFASEDGDVVLPDDWYVAPIARFQFHSDAGDPGVGIGPTSGWMLADNQAGTVLERVLQSVEAGAIGEG